VVSSALKASPVSIAPRRVGTPIPDCPISDTADCPEILSFCGALRSSAANRELGAAVMLSSALRGEGKTMVGVAVAVALRKTFAVSVLYIDASLDGDVIARWPAGSHLSWDQIERSPPAKLSRASGPELKILSLPADRLDMLFSAGAGETPLPLETRIRERFDMILIDSPSVSEAPLVTSMGRFIDGVILVVEAERTRWPVVQNAKEEFERRDATVLGVFLNRRRRYIPSAVYKLL
jgi:Mrp family chromosome partitioning ATPase